MGEPFPAAVVTLRRWRTELELSSGKSFDDRHWSAALGAKPKRVGFLGGRGLWFDLRWNCFAELVNDVRFTLAL